MYLQQYEVSMTILDYFYPRLKNYIDFDFTDQLSPPRLKKDGNYYATYVSEIRQEHAVLSPDRCSVVLKEIPASLTEIYRKISSRWSPYIETVYGVLSENGHSLAINEFIQKPACLSYPTKELSEMRSLTLEDFILKMRTLSEKEALIFLLQLCEALENISELSLVHGDVSPQNILLTDVFPLNSPKQQPTSSTGKGITELCRNVAVKLIDFDIAREEKGSHHMVTTVAGTNPYAAPEILDYQTPTDRVDIYSLGCVFAFMLTGKSPKQMSREEFQSSLSKSVRKIINKCTADYSRRYKDVTHLRKDISALLSTSTMPVPEFFHILPGLRSGKPLEICIFSLIYCALFHFLIFLICPSPSLAWILPAVAVSVILTTDVFHLGRHFAFYQLCLEQQPEWCYLFKFLIGFVLPFTVLRMIS